MPAPPAKALRLNPAKLLHSKWTAVTPVQREKHFIVTALIEPEQADTPADRVTLEAALTRRSVNLR